VPVFNSIDIVLIGGTALGFIGHSYRHFAHRYDWPSGAAFTDANGVARLVGGWRQRRVEKK